MTTARNPRAFDGLAARAVVERRMDVPTRVRRRLCALAILDLRECARAALVPRTPRDAASERG
jgi:hypothetical protein